MPGEPHCIHYSPSAFGMLAGRVDTPKTPLRYPCCEELALNSGLKMTFDVCRDSLAHRKGLEAIESNGIQGG